MQSKSSISSYIASGDDDIDNITFTFTHKELSLWDAKQALYPAKLQAVMMITYHEFSLSQRKLYTQPYCKQRWWRYSQSHTNHFHFQMQNKFYIHLFCKQGCWMVKVIKRFQSDTLEWKWSLQSMKWEAQAASLGLALTFLPDNWKMIKEVDITTSTHCTSQSRFRYHSIHTRSSFSTVVSIIHEIGDSNNLIKVCFGPPPPYQPGQYARQQGDDQRGWEWYNKLHSLCILQSSVKVWDYSW